MTPPVTAFVLWLVLPNGTEHVLGNYDNPHSCAGHAAKQRHAQVQVETKTKRKLGYKFICKEN
jgi:hypothetical protein